ncbi:MAG: serine hydrolase domain-containing protein [Pararhodobacter sp.]
MTKTTINWSREIAGKDVVSQLRGRIAAGFEPLAEAFAENFTAHGERAASVHVIHRGHEVASLWGGIARGTDGGDAKPWAEDSLCVVFSCTKAATAACIHLLAVRGLVQLDAPVADYWPAFADGGKGGITLRMVLDHSAGIPALPVPLKADCLTDHGYMVEQIAASEPLLPPGTRTAYHPVIGGFILAEVIRRVDGRSLGAFFDAEIARPLGLDFWIGLPAEQEGRVALIEHFVPSKGGAPTAFGTALREAGSLQNLFFFNHGDWMAKGVNRRDGREAEIGAASGVTNAAGLARFFEALRPGSPLGLDAATLAGFSQASSATHLDGMLLQPTRFGPGFMLAMDNRRQNGPDAGDSFLIGRQAFGHVGAGGSFGFHDPEVELSMGYAMTQMGAGFLVNPRGQALMDSAYAACR